MKVFELPGTRFSKRIFIRWSDEDKDTIWITEGNSVDDFYGASITLPKEQIKDFIEALRTLNEGVE